MNPIPRQPGEVRSRRPGVSPFVRLTAAAAFAWFAPEAIVRADTVIDFETNPNLPAQPNNFAAAGPEQTYTQTGVYTIDGGVVLGNPTFLAGFPAHGSAPNLYGTTDTADPSLLQTITLIFPTAEHVTGVSGVLFNGQSFTESYTLTASSGNSTISTLNPSVAANNLATDFANFSFSSTSTTPITSVTFTTPNAATNGWDFFVDTIHVTAAASSAVPEPSPPVLAGLGLLAGLGYRWARNRNR